MATSPMHRVATIFRGFTGSPYYSQLYFDAGGQTAQQAADAVAAFWNDLEGHMGDGLTWEVVTPVDVVNPVNGQITSQEAVTPDSGAGTISTNILPPSSQGLVQLRTGVFVGGRELRGRVFIPGATENDSSGRVPESTYTNDVTAAANTLRTSASWVVWSRTHGQWQGVQSSVLAQYWAVLRSRRD